MVVGQMVIAHQRLMKVVDIDGDTAALKFIDIDGEVRLRFASVASLTSLWAATRPRAVWPEGGDLDVLLAEQQEREAAAIKKAERKVREKAARKARRSNKIKRGVAA